MSRGCSRQESMPIRRFPPPALLTYPI
eukprot:gene26235-biopygen15137